MDKWFGIIEILASLFDASASILFAFFATKDKRDRGYIPLTLLFIVIMYSLQEVSENTVVQMITIGSIVTVYSLLIMQQKRFWQAIFYGALFVVLLLASNVVVVNIMACVMQASISKVLAFETIGRLLGILIHKIVFATAILFMLTLLRRFLLRKEEMSVILLVLCLNTYLLSVICNLQEAGNFDIMEQSEYLIMALVVVTMSVVIFICMVRIGDRSRLEMENRALQMTLEGQKASIQKSERLYQDTRMLKHDMKHYLQMAKDLLDQKEYEEVDNCLEHLLQHETFQTRVFYTGIPVLDVVLNEKEEFCRQVQTSFKAEVSCSEVKQHLLDIGVILANLLDNAIEAQKAVEESSRKVELKMFTKGDTLFIMLRNSVTGEVLLQNPKLHTTKDNAIEHGWGTKSVAKLVKELDGTLEYQQECDAFTVSVMISIA